MFYAHKIILVNASSRFKQMLSSKFCEGNPPIVQIHDIRYDIFEVSIHLVFKLRMYAFMTFLNVKTYLIVQILSLDIIDLMKFTL